jgi:hypothetical protein
MFMVFPVNEFNIVVIKLLQVLNGAQFIFPVQN